MRIAVDENLCTGHGRCYTLAPDLLSCDDEGYVSIRGASIEVPPDQEGPAREACTSCPERAVSLIE